MLHSNETAAENKGTAIVHIRFNTMFIVRRY